MARTPKTPIIAAGVTGFAVQVFVDLSLWPKAIVASGAVAAAVALAYWIDERLGRK
jgi:hypothetical protein